MCMKSKEKIEEAMLQLMEHNSFDEITISEICGKADVARRTFYNNFTAKEEVLKEKCARIVGQMIEKSGSYKEDPSQWVKESLLCFFQTCYTQREFLHTLASNKLCYLFENELYQQLLENEYLHRKDIEFHVKEHLRHYVVSFYAASALKIYKIWAGNQFGESVEELAELYWELVFGNQQNS